MAFLATARCSNTSGLVAHLVKSPPGSLAIVCTMRRRTGTCRKGATARWASGLEASTTSRNLRARSCSSVLCTFRISARCVFSTNAWFSGCEQNWRKDVSCGRGQHPR